MRQLIRLGLTSLMILAATTTLVASTITFQQRSVDANQTVIEDGMSYTTGDNFIVRLFVGNPPSGLLGSPIASGTFKVTRADLSDFIFDGYDFGSFAPGQQSDTWLFRGLLDDVQQFAFFDATSSAFVTRITGQLSIIDRLEITIATGSAAGGVADNFVFTPVPEPSSLALVGITGIIGLGYARHRSKRTAA